MKRSILRGFEISQDTHAALKRVAAQEDRTLAAQVRRVLNKWADGVGSVADLDVRPSQERMDQIEASRKKLIEADLQQPTTPAQNTVYNTASIQQLKAEVAAIADVVEDDKQLGGGCVVNLVWLLKELRELSSN